MFHNLLWRLSLIWLILVCAHTAPAADYVVSDVQIGADGLFKVGCWTRLEFELSGPAGSTVQPVITVPDPDGNPVDAFWNEVTLPASGAVRVSEMIRLGRLGAVIRIHMEHKGVRQTARTFQTSGLMSDGSGHLIKSLPQHHQIWLVHGNHPAFPAAADRWNQTDADSLHLVSIPDLSLFRSDVGEGINVIVLSPDMAVTTEQSLQLSRWVQRGGRLVIPVGDGVDDLRDSEIAEWLPFLPSGRTEVRNLVPLRELVPKSSSLKVITVLPAAQFDTGSAKFLAGNLVARGSHGLGQVTMTSMPLHLDPLASWDALSQAELAVKLADVRAPWELMSEANRDGTELNPTGVSDFQSQLLNQLEDFPQVSRGTNWTVMGTLLALLLLVGPLDYLIVHRILQRPHWTWVTLPVFAVVFGVVLLRLSEAANQRDLVANQLEIIDVDSANQLIRSRSWLSFYSPATRRYEIAIAPFDEKLTASGSYSVGPRLGWLERPEEGYRGMYHGGGLDIGKPRYQLVATHDAVHNLPLHIWSTGGLDCEWERSGVSTADLVESNLSVSRGRQLVGNLTSHLPGTITSWFIAYDGTAFYSNSDAEVLEGQEFDASQTRSTVMSQALSLQQNYYDPLSSDQEYMVRIMSFHQVAGGRKFSRLRHAALGELDCSAVHQLDRAVLYGVLKDAHLTRLTIDGTEPPLAQQATYVRILLPVTRQQTDISAPPPPDLIQVPK